MNNEKFDNKIFGRERKRHDTANEFFQKTGYVFCRWVNLRFFLCFRLNCRTDLPWQRCALPLHCCRNHFSKFLTFALLFNVLFLKGSFVLLCRLRSKTPDTSRSLHFSILTQHVSSAEHVLYLDTRQIRSLGKHKSRQTDDKHLWTSTLDQIKRGRNLSAFCKT